MKKKHLLPEHSSAVTFSLQNHWFFWKNGLHCYISLNNYIAYVQSNLYGMRNAFVIWLSLDPWVILCKYKIYFCNLLSNLNDFLSLVYSYFCTVPILRLSKSFRDELKEFLERIKKKQIIIVNIYTSSKINKYFDRSDNKINYKFNQMHQWNALTFHKIM